MNPSSNQKKHLTTFFKIKNSCYNLCKYISKNIQKTFCCNIDMNTIIEPIKKEENLDTNSKIQIVPKREIQSSNVDENKPNHQSNNKSNTESETLKNPNSIVISILSIDNMDFSIRNIEYIYNVYETFYIKFNPLFELKIGDKISVYDGSISVSMDSWFQSMERWYYKQSRKISMDYLKQLFLEYNHFSNKTLQQFHFENSEFIYCQNTKVKISKCKTLLKQILDVNIKLITSLIELTQTYKNDIEVINVYNNIHSSLIVINTRIITELY